MVLVTGGTGFLGSELIRQLLEMNVPVRALRRADSIIPPILAGRQVDWQFADIRDHFSLEDALEGISIVYHCAAFISFDPGQRKAMKEINIEGTANIVNLCLEREIRLVHVSSVAALGQPKFGETVTEKHYWDDPVKPGGYAVSKYESEMEVWRGIAEGMDAVVVNPSIIIGPNATDRESGRLFRTAAKGVPVYTSGTLGFVAVEDVARAMIQLEDSKISGQRFIINAETWSVREFFTATAKHLGVQAPWFRLSPWMLSLAWRLNAVLRMAGLKSSGLTSDTARSAGKKHDYSSRKLLATLPGFTFKPVAEVIADCCKALK
jgi:dihydroflavonol-4-reductase